MEQTIFKIIWENAPATTFVIIGTASITLITFKVLKFYGRFERMETKLDDVNNNVQVKFDIIDKRLETLETRANSTDVRLTVMDAKLDALIDKVNLLTEFVFAGNPVKRTR